MQYCSKCKVSIETPHKRCPLCQGKLEGEGEEESKLFPDLSGEKSRVFLGFKVFTFCCIAILVLGLAVNLMFPAPVFWAGFLAAAVVLYQKTESAEKYVVADGAFVCGVSVLGLSDRVSGLVFRVRNSCGNSSGISCAYGHCEADEAAGILLYDLLSAGLCSRAFAASVLACGTGADA